MAVDTTELRTRARLIEPGFPGTAAALLAVADENDALRAALAVIPHAPLCQLLMLRDDEPCSCAKSAAHEPSGPPLAVTGMTAVHYPAARRLTVAGPHGNVLGLPAVASVRVDLHDDHLTVSYTNPERNT